MNKQTKGGFTLIELLVVIAIISILAAILFPVFSSAREKARQTTCTSNLRQLGQAMLQYEQDYDELLPGIGSTFGNYAISYNNGNLGYLGGAWAGSIYPYVKANGVYECPDDLTVPAATPVGTQYVSYLFNSDLVDLYDYGQGPSATNPDFSSVRLNEPTKTIMMVESKGTQNVDIAGSPNGIEDACSVPGEYLSASGNGIDVLQQIGVSNCQDFTTQYDTGYLGGYNETTAPNIFGGGPTGPSPTGSAPYAAAVGRHTGGSNFLLADGHVKFLQPNSVSPGFNAETPSDSQNASNVNGLPTAAGTEGSIIDGSGVTHQVAATFSAV